MVVAIPLRRRFLFTATLFIKTVDPSIADVLRKVKKQALIALIRPKFTTKLGKL